ncbi:hypothetical protein FGO68_gene5700 [Halteria grandinella]|uniref:Uncharacterized protein n=1 Tax=Halteria grandinella TaxID=5974 RepID=A0A8J8SWW4_HALGN|nr:hypothetical protein FGO68_gene5700 [Halteria grandinella]
MGEGFCNYRATAPTTFKTSAFKNATVSFEAVVDQAFGRHMNMDKLSPNVEPQLHLTQMRTKENYEAKQGKRVLRGDRVVKYSLQEYMQEKTDIAAQIQAAKQRGTGMEGLSVKLNTIENYQMTGVASLTKVSQNTFMFNGQFNRLPVSQTLSLSIMEYGDLSSLIVEYPDYNSLGSVLLKLGELHVTTYTNEASRLSLEHALPQGIPSFEALAGRALIVTTQNGDLVAFGVIADEQQILQKGEYPLVKGIAMCENLQSTVPYRAYFDLMQLQNGNVTFRGMLRTSQNMNNDDKMIIDVNGGRKFDIDFESAYGTDKGEDLFQYWHPCYVINEETVDSQDTILGRKLEMYAINSQLSYSFIDDADVQQSSQFHNQQQLLRILESSTCFIGSHNPHYRISDESFCRHPLSRAQQVERKYTAMALVNFTIIGFVAGVVVAFIFYYVQKLSGVGKSNNGGGSDKYSRRLERMQNERNAEAVMAADISFQAAGTGARRKRRGGTGINDSTVIEGSSYTDQSRSLQAEGIEMQNYQTQDSEREGYSMTVRTAAKDRNEFVELGEISSIQKHIEDDEDEEHM